MSTRSDHSTRGPVGEPVAQRCPDGGADGKKDTGLAASDVDLLPLRELRVFARIASAMLDAESPRKAIDAALGDLGAYYGARRVYVVTVASDSNLMSIPFEWVDSACASIRDHLSGVSASRFPLIMHNIDETEPVLVSRPRPSTPRGDHGPAGETWRFCIVPVSHTNERSLALCVDDPTRNYGSWGLARCVAAHVLNERRLECGPEHEVPCASDGLGGMPGPRELECIMSRGGSGAWSSLGAVIASVPEVSALVSKRGFSHALELYEAIRHTLERDFGEGSVFRTADMEFVALSPNSSYQLFVRRCARSRAALAAAHAGEMRFGSAWADRASDVWGVVDEARVIAARDVGTELPEAGGEKPLEIDEPPAPVPMRDQAVERRFTVYLQPKIDMRSGRLVGAEALARVVGEDGSAGSPTHEIDRLEESGEISRLDYFVFDRTLALMSSWARRRLTAIPVSTNFSRVTLVNPTSLASVLAIMSRYPDVPAELLEMEVTETAIDLGGTTLAELVQRFHELGMRVALDDFGSHYSNVSVLANVPFDTVKLDRSLVIGVSGNDVSRTFVHGIAQICADRNMTCVAEGVETPEQARALTDEGCVVCQGFYYDKPMPPELFEEKYLRRGDWR
ncbi:EAL domain-containing protein [Thermophilibacter sp.]